jgi:hypothetical protein
MKRATLSVLLLMIVSIALTVGGSPRTRGSLSSLSAPATLAKESVEYGGVNFTYDSSLATQVQSKTIAAEVYGKPSDIIPEHPSFTLVGYSRGREYSRHGDAEIKVFSLAKFRDAVAIASVEGNKGVVYPAKPPAWTTYFDEEVSVLKQLLAAKPGTHIGRFLAKARGEKGCSAAMPFLPMWEACMAFVGHVRYVNFKNGKGVFFLTQWDRETEQISNDALEYAYQGITDDGRYWVYAEFGVAAPFLPRGDEPGVVAWNEKNYLLSHQSKRYQQYLHPVVTRLEALPSTRFQPNLNLLEQLIESLEVKVK